MKRDINLVKNILSHIEDCEDIITEVILDNLTPFPNYTDQVVTYHVCLLHEAGYITGGVFMGNYSEIMEFGTLQLTWQGHEFLDVLKDKDVMHKVLSLGKDMSFDIIKSVAKKLIETKAEKYLGITDK